MNHLYFTTQTTEILHSSAVGQCLKLRHLARCVSEWVTDSARPTAIRKPSHASFGLLSFGTRPLGLIEAGCEPSNDAGFGKSTDRSKSYLMAETSGPRLVMQCPCKPKKNVGTLESVLFFGLADCSHMDCFPYRVTVSSDPLSKAATLSEWNWSREGGTR